MGEDPHPSDELRRQFGLALARRMGWSQREAIVLADHVVLNEESGETYFELRWADQGVVAGVVTDTADGAGLADEFAEAVAADLRMRVHRLGERLPWSHPDSE